MLIQELLGTAGRTIAVYLFVLLVVRLLGKREVGNFTAFDLLAALMIGETVDEIIFKDVTMAQGFMAIAAIGALHWINSWLSFKSQLVDRVTGAEPTVLIRHGHVDEKALASERINREELVSQLRLQGVDDLEEIKQATLEPSGHVSVVKEEWAEPLTKGDLEEALQKRRSA